MAGENILLIEPGYKNKYPPLGLMKIAQYHGSRGKRDNVRFIKGEDRSVLMTNWDRIYVTTLFSFEFMQISQSIDFALHVVNGNAKKIFVGGIAASLMHNRFIAEPRWRGICFIKGLLDASPAIALQLADFSQELSKEDKSETPIEDLVPDYDILAQICYQYPVHDAYFAYASRGCIRKCSFCGVPTLEGNQRDAAPLSLLVHGVEELYGPKKDLILMDNNVVASPRFTEIVAEIRNLGFTPGAKLHRQGQAPVLRRVDFNQGVDARILCNNPMYLRELSTICLKPLRIAFDHWGMRIPYSKSIRYAHEFGLHELSNYMLFNFHDSPSDLYLRLSLNTQLNEELGIRIRSFPMRYQPIDLPNKSHIGEKWTRYQLRSIQIILQATQGIVSCSPQSLRNIFGETEAAFYDRLLFPHRFIFNREYYEKSGGAGEFEEFTAKLRAFSEGEQAELLCLLSSTTPQQLENLRAATKTPKIREILSFYVPPNKEDTVNPVLGTPATKCSSNIPDEENIEDACLTEDSFDLRSDISS